MLTLPEKIIFLLAVLVTAVAVIFAVRRLVRIIGAGQGRPDWRLAWKHLARVTLRIVTFQPVFRFRFWTSLFHALVGWGFGFYLLVNLFDVIRAFVPGFELSGMLGNLYRLLADLLTVGVLVAMVFFVVRRFVFRPASLSARESTLFHPKAQTGICRDSAIVVAFIIVHVGTRLVGESMNIALPCAGFYCFFPPRDLWQPFASLLAQLWTGPGTTQAAMNQGIHAAFWLSLGTILLFLPYFPSSKHIHLFFAPLNFLLKPRRRSMGEMSYLDLDDSSLEHFGAAKLADLGWEQLMDAYACIMCFRCQDVCPAYQTGKVLSPAVLEINKRYLLNSGGARRVVPLPVVPLAESVIAPEAVWACTACGACVDICPVGNEPMRDILDIRRSLTLMENAFPKQLEAAFRNLERTANPWGVPASERMKWADGLHVPTVEQNPEPEVLWWVGCAPATDARAQKTARAFAKILEAAGVNYAVLGQNEQCTGDSARRAGREDIFFGLAQANVALLNEIKPKRIVTTCPHCLHTLKNEYPAFGGNYTVIHHTQLIDELLASGQLTLEPQSSIINRPASITFHDPCYLGRQNGIVEAPRRALRATGTELAEMPRRAEKSFCCGAGGAQMWKEEEHGTRRVSAARLAEAKSTGAETVVVGCPFCLTMLSEAAAAERQGMMVKDVAELLAERLK